MSKIIPLQTIHFSISTLFSSIWPIDTPTMIVLDMTLNCSWWWGSNLELFPGLLWPGVVVPVRVPSMCQIELFDQRRSGSDCDEEVLYIPQNSSITGTSSVCLVLYPGYSLGVVLPLCRDAVDVFYSPSWLG